MNIGQIFKRAADLNEEVAFYNAFYDGFSETATLSEEEKKLLNANHTAFSLELRKRFNSTLWSYQCPSICLGPNDIDKLSQATKIKLEGDVAPDDQWRVIHHLVELTQMPQFQTLTIVCWDSEGDFVGAVFSDDEGETDSHCPSRFYLRASRFCRFPPKSKSLRASLRSCRLTQPWCRSQEEKLIEVKLRKRLSFLTDPLVEKFAGVSRVNAVLTRDMATLLAAKPALVSLALNAALSKPAEDKEQQADFKQGLPLNVVLPKASEDGVMTSLNVRNVHIARLASSGSRRMPAPFLLRNWGTCNSETEQRYEKHLIDDARLFGGKLSFGMALLFLGALDNHSVNYDVLYPLEESVWTLIDKDVQALSADRLNEAGDHLAKWQSTSEVVAEYLRDNIDKAELHLMHMMGGPTVASVMTEAQSYFTGHLCCVRLDRLSRGQQVDCTRVEEADVQTHLPSTFASVAVAIVRSQSALEAGDGSEAQFLSQVDIHPEPKEIEALIDIVSAGHGESLGKMLGVKSGGVEDDDFEKLELQEFSDELFFSKLASQPAGEEQDEEVKLLVEDLKRMGLGELANEPLMAETSSSSGDSAVPEEEDESVEGPDVMGQLLDAEVRSLRDREKNPESSCAENLMSSISLEDCAQPGPATLLLSELRRLGRGG